MNWRIQLGMAALALSFSLQAFAEGDIYIWSNDVGLVAADAKACQVKTSKTSAFRVVENADQSRNFEFFYDNRCGGTRGKFCEALKIPARSIVKTEDGRKYDDYELATATGLNSIAGLTLTEGEWAFRNYLAYLPKASLHPIEKYTIQITDEAIVMNDETGAKIELGSIPGTDIRIVDAFLIPSVTRSGYATLKCGSKVYSLFDLTYGEGEEPEARIAINREETRLLRNVRVAPASVVVEPGDEDEQSEEADTAADVALPAPPVATETAVVPKAEDTAGVVDSTKVAPVPHKRTTVLSAFSEVVCLASKNGEAALYDEKQENVIQKLANGTKLKSFQPFFSIPFLPPAPYIRVQIEATGINGWLLTSQKSQAGNCASLEAEPSADAPIVEAPLVPGEYTTCTADGGQVRTYDAAFKSHEQDKFLNTGEKVSVIDGTLRNKPEPNGHYYVQVKSAKGEEFFVASTLLVDRKCSIIATETSAQDAQSFEGSVFPTTTSTGYSYISAGKRPFSHSKLKKFSGYKGGWGLYGAGRKGRAHAATDLYQRFGLPLPEGKGYRGMKSSHYGGKFRAMRSGTVLRGPHDFYLGTANMAILHDDGTVGRYGEIYLKKEYKDNKVQAGQTLGHICWVGVGGVPPMLHFENYDATKAVVAAAKQHNGLTVGSGAKINGRRTQRHSGLFNRTQYMLELEKKTFGTREQ